MSGKTRRSVIQAAARRTWGVALLLVAAGAAVAQDGNAIALVNGQPLSRQEFIDILIEARGVEVLQQMIVLQVAKQEARRLGLKVTQHDIDVEYQRSLDSIAAEAGMDIDEATEQNKRRALEQVLAERGLSMAEFRLGMRRNAYLRKIVERNLKITEETLREEFARTCGDKVVIRHIQIPQRDTRTLNQAVDMLRNGADFAAVARRLSQNARTAAQGGLMEPFTFDDPKVPPALREAAFSLKPGGISSPILVGRFFHIIKVERRIAQQAVKFEDVREQIERQVRERAIPQAMAKLAKELFVEARIRVLDGKLRERYQQFLDEAAEPN